MLVSLVLLATVALLWHSLPESAQSARVAGLSAPVDITFDGDGLPRVRAASALDGAAALGFVHARDRMFQMELMRRAASGRLSELAGPATLRLDRTMRVLGLRRRAVAELTTLPNDVHARLDAYANGVNAWIEARGRFAAPEFMVLGPPEPWTAVDSLLWGKTMGLWLSGNWRTEVMRAALLARLPADRIFEFWPPQDGARRPDAFRQLPRPITERLAALLPRFPEPFTQPDTASNEWAVDGRFSASGAPLLAGDPHLAYAMPGIWYLARIETPEGVLAGATAPGVPFLVIGHNSQIAWTFTTTGADTQDVFVETMRPDGRYEAPDGPKEFVRFDERIQVRGQPDLLFTVRETRHGPVISDLDDPSGPVLAVQMANLADGDSAVVGLLALNQAGDVEQAGHAAPLITSPVQNLLVADRIRIAQYTTGRVPLRRDGDGRTPQLGADGAHDWIGFAQGDALPHVVAPESGRLVNANERTAPPDFPVFMGADWFADWRARRIRALLDGGQKFDAATFAAWQTDARSAFAEQVLPLLRTTAPPAGIAQTALFLLSEWDGTMARDLPQPLIFNAWMAQFEAMIVDRARAPLNAVPSRPDFAAWVLSPAGAPWCDGDCRPLLRAALSAAVVDLSKRFGPDPAAWRWGDAHPAVFGHPVLQSLPGLDRWAVARIAQPGDDTTIFRGSMRTDSFDAVHGPGFRGVYDLSDLDRSLFIATPGQSGNLLSSHARDMMQRWRDGGSIQLGPNPSSISATIRLDP